MSFVCHQCGFSNDEGVAVCQNPSPLADGSECKAFLGDQPGWKRTAPEPEVSREEAEEDPALRPAATHLTAPPPSAHGLSTMSLTAMPEQSARCRLRIGNNSQIADEFTLEVTGDASSWATVEPPMVTLPAKGESSAEVTFRPPRSPQIPAGRVPFAISILSKANPLSTTWAHGEIEVGAFVELALELAPTAGNDHRGATQRVIVGNHGNTPVQASLIGYDADDELRFQFSPPSLVIEPGGVAEAAVRIRPRRRMWFGQPSRAWSFEIRAEPDGPGPAADVIGSWEQRPVFGVLAPIGLGAIGTVLVAMMVGILLVVAHGPGLLGSLIGGNHRGGPPAAAHAVGSSPVPSPEPFAAPAPAPSPSSSPSPSPNGDPSPSPSPSPSASPSPLAANPPSSAPSYWPQPQPQPAPPPTSPPAPPPTPTSVPVTPRPSPSATASPSPSPTGG